NGPSGHRTVRRLRPPPETAPGPSSAVHPPSAGGGTTWAHVIHSPRPDSSATRTAAPPERQRPVCANPVIAADRRDSRTPVAGTTLGHTARGHHGRAHRSRAPQSRAPRRAPPYTSTVRIIRYPAPKS